MTRNRTYGAADLSFTGAGLNRPECVICLANGRMIAANFDGGVSVIEPGGEVWHLVGRGDVALKPNGICLVEDGSILATHLGATTGGVYRLHPDGRLDPYLLEADGIALPPTNFVHRDAIGRTWITVSTRKVPRALGYRRDAGDGFVVRVDDRGARIVADGLGFTNECLVHPDCRRIFINETFARRVSVFAISPTGDLVRERSFEDFEAGEFPDGMALDAAGGLWLACIIANRVIRLGRDFERRVVLDGADPELIAWTEEAYAADRMAPEHLARAPQPFDNISSLAFGGTDLRTIYLGNLLGDRIASFRQDVVGAPPVHWHYPGPVRIG